MQRPRLNTHILIYARSTIQSNQLRARCHRIIRMISDLVFKQPHNSLSGSVIRDILSKSKEKELLKDLVEDCLLANQFVMSMFEQVASALQDFRLGEHDAKAICNRVFIDDATVKSILYFPFFTEAETVGNSLLSPNEEIIRFHHQQ